MQAPMKPDGNFEFMGLGPGPQINMGVRMPPPPGMPGNFGTGMPMPNLMPGMPGMQPQMNMGANFQT